MTLFWANLQRNRLVEGEREEGCWSVRCLFISGRGQEADQGEGETEVEPVAREVDV